jgi:hypothetical protein
MNPLAVISGTFLLWIVARKRFDAYAALVHKSGGSADPSPVAPASAAATSDNPISEVAASASDIMARLWNGITT